MFLTGSFAVLIRAAHFDFAQYRPPPFWIFMHATLHSLPFLVPGGGWGSQPYPHATGFMQEFSTIPASVRSK